MSTIQIHTDKPPPGSRNRWFTDLLVDFSTGLLLGLLKVERFTSWPVRLTGHAMRMHTYIFLAPTGNCMPSESQPHTHCTNTYFLRPSRAPTVKMHTFCAPAAPLP